MIALVPIAVNAFVLGSVAVVSWLLPDLLPPTVRMGVRVPVDRREDPAVGRAVRRYRAGTVVAGAAGAALLALSAAGGPVGAAFAAPFVTGIGAAAAYVAARRRLLRHKWSAGWAAAGPVTRVTPFEPAPSVTPLAAWWLAAALVWAATLVAGILVYPSLPSVLATHYDAAGRPDAWAPKSPASVFGLSIAGAVVLAAFTGISLAILRSKPYLDPSDAGRDAYRQGVFRGRMARGLLGLGACLEASLGFGSLMIWGIGPAGPAGTLLVLAPVLAGTLGLLVLAVRTGQLGSRVAQPLPPGPLPATAVPRELIPDDDRFWRLGLVYLNRDDPAFLVPKRFGVGWTINLGNPWAWLVVGFPLVLVLLSYLASVHLL